jgi:very-short-patch-repair endonuclease
MQTQRTHRETGIARLAQSQFGVFTREQALRAGFTASTIKQRLNRGVWTLADHNVYRVSATPETWHQRLIAACVAGPAVASHRSAGRLWDLPGMPDDIVEVTALRHRRRRSPDVIWHESYHLSGRDVTEIEGIPCTRPVRTFLDLGVVLSPDELETVLNEGVRRSLLPVPAIAQRLEELGPMRRGTAVVRAVLDRQVRGRRAPESVLETRFLQLVRAAGVPEPVPQHQVRLDGKVIARLDFAYVDPKVAIELDGAAYHSGEIARKRDRRRDTQLGALGWRVLRFDWDDITSRSNYVLRTMRSLGLK